MSLALALMLQAATPAPKAAVPAPKPADAPARPVAEALRPIDAATAVEAFKSICWANLGNEDGVAAAVAAGTVPLAAVSGRSQPGTRLWRAEEALLRYSSSGDAAPGAPRAQCVMSVRLSGSADQLVLSARVAQALSLRTGRTRTAATGAQTDWEVAGPDGVRRLIATTRNAVGGTTQFRLAAVLLAPR